MRHTFNARYLIKKSPFVFLLLLVVLPVAAQELSASVVPSINANSSVSSEFSIVNKPQQAAVISALASANSASSMAATSASASQPELAMEKHSSSQLAVATASISSSVESSLSSSSAVNITSVEESSRSSNASLLALSSNASLGQEVVIEQETVVTQETSVAVDAEEKLEPLSLSKYILDTEVKPNSSVRLTWNSEAAVGAFSEATPILVVNGATPGKTLCMTAAIHGDELNGIEMIRRVMFDIDPAKLTGTIIGVPVANIMGFRRNSRYLPDRRDWNRYFPGNTHGSAASRLAHSFFTKIIMHCDALVDLHTGSFHRTNLPQLRADLADENVARLAQNFGVIAVLNGRGNPNSLRAAAVRAGIPAVTLEAGEPMAMQNNVVEEGVNAITTLLAKTGMYGKKPRWTRIAPVYYRSAWVRANQSGILFSKATLGQRVKEEEVLGTVTDPITNARATIRSPYNGRIIGMALDQVVLPGFAAYHIGIQTPEAILIEESQLNGEMPEEDEEDGDDSGVDSTDENEPETGVSKAQDRMADE